MVAGPDPPALRGLTHISLSVTDLARSFAFYRDVLGLAVLAEPYDGEVFAGREAMLLLPPATGVCLQQHDASSATAFDPTVTGLDHFSFGVRSLDDLYLWSHRLGAAGVECSGVRELPGWGWFVEFTDPDGIQLELHWLDR